MLNFLVGAVLSAQDAPRERIRFDADWKFFARPTLSGEARLGPFQWEWKLAEGDSFDTKVLPTDLDSGPWRATRVGTNVLERRQNGWFRTDLGSDPEGAEKVIHFDSTDEDAAVWLNGKHIGTHIGFGTAFEFPVASAWRKEGPNRLVVLVKNWAQTGGINGGVTLVRPDNEPIPPEITPEHADADWRSLHLPHDYVIEGRFAPEEDNSHGSLPKPIGFYRKTFVPPKRYRNKHVWLEFDGVYRNSDVFLNGKAITHQDSGYAGFRVDLSPHLRYGEPNLLAVRVDPRKNEGWWYEGGGIYRHVWLNIADPVHIEPDGIFARTKLVAKTARVNVDVAIQNVSSQVVERRVHVRLISPAGKMVDESSSAITVPPTGATTHHAFSVANPERWDLDNPNRYRVEVSLADAAGVRDADGVYFGIRDIRWDADRGFFLNGKPVKLKGTSNHQDHAGVGIALSDRLMEWRLRLLKSMGANAYRTAHNPVAREMLDACDRLGILVLDETRHLGDSTSSKSAPGTTANDLSDLRYQVKRDRNHPCVIAWSLFNEEPLQETAEGALLFTQMRRVVNQLDGTRLCTGATNGGFEGGIVGVTELFGINYNIAAYAPVRAKYPRLPLFGSETGSAVSTRGIYETDAKRSYVSAYDVNAASFGNTAEQAWRAVAERDWMAGCFVWTGFDYKGEPTPYGWPAIHSAFGIIDITGFPKDTYWYYKAWWGEEPVVHLLPHWNWRKGQTVKVWAHSNADRVELWLNGRSLGSRDVPKWGHAEWEVPFEPGRLEAKGYRGRKVIARDAVETAGSTAKIRLRTDWPNLLADAQDTALVQVEVLDANGRLVPTADQRITFRVEGPATIAGVGNGDPTDHDPDVSTDRRAFGGRCMVLLRSNGQRGTVTLYATAEGLPEAKLSLRTARPR